MKAAGAAPVSEGARALPTSPKRVALRFIARMVRKRLGLLAPAFAAVAFGAISAVAVQYAMKLLVDALAAPERVVTRAAWALAGFLALLVAENVFWRAGGYLGSRAIISFGAAVRAALLDHVMGHSWRYFTTHMSGSLANRFAAAGAASTAILATLLWNVAPPLADLTGSVVVLATVDWRLSATLIMASLVITGTLAWFGYRGDRLHQAYYERAAVTLGGIAEVLASMSLVKTFNGQRREAARFDERLREEAHAHQRSWSHTERMRVAYDVMFWFVIAAILTSALHGWEMGSASTGDVVVVVTLSFRILSGSRELSLSLLGVQQQFGALAEAAEVLLAPHERPDSLSAVPLTVAQGAIEFDEMCFAHPGAPALFRSLSLSIPAGQKLAVVGQSGAGKSTLLRLLQRFEDPQSGSIRIDGQDLAHATQHSIAEAIAVVSQDTELFQRSVFDNIVYGNPRADASEVIDAARMAQCHDFAIRLPAGYDTLVGERGVLLSGGQRQRIAIARAILKNAPIIVLDEATSSLDSSAEAEVQRALEELTRGRTVIAVAHRLSTIMSFDRVVVLHGGQIVEDGCPRILSRSLGPFGRMWRIQHAWHDGGHAVKQAV